MIECPKDGCPGTIEASTKIFLNVDEATVNDAGEIIIEEISFSHLNDEYLGYPCNIEAEMDVSCDHCGEEFAWNMGDGMRALIAPQPIGGAERTVGRRGGT